MSTLAGDFWVCGDCRSINNAGARQCYNCRTPRDRAAVDPESIDPSSHGPLRTIELPAFKGSRWAAALASILILAVAVMSIVQYSLGRQLVDYEARGIATAEDYAYVGSIIIVAIGIALLALIAWALWLSRTVTSMPALGLGYPAANGMMAFIENFIPILNLWRVPAIVRDVARRLQPKVGGDETMTRGEALVFAAWISVFGGYLVPRILSFFTDNQDTLVTIAGIGLGLSAVGAVCLVVLIWWVESRVAERRRLQLAGMETPAVATTEASTTATVGEVAREPMPDAAIAAVALDAARDRSAVAAFASSGSSGVDSFRLPPTEDAPLMAAAAAATTSASVSETPAGTVDETSAPSIGSEPAPAAESSVVAETVLVAEPAAETVPAAEPAPEAAAVVATPAEVVPPEIAPEETQTPEPQAPTPAEAPAAPPPSAGPPNLTIRVTSRGLMTAELDGEIEHVMLDDLGQYAEALSHVAGTATIHVPNDEGMPALIGKRAQRILEDAGVQVTLA